jgi:hypothetical protein
MIHDVVEDEPYDVNGVEVPIDTSQANPNGRECARRGARRAARAHAGAPRCTAAAAARTRAAERARARARAGSTTCTWI